MVSHAIGLVGVIYQMSINGGARIATVAGTISAGPRIGQWLILLGGAFIKKLLANLG